MFSFVGNLHEKILLDNSCNQDVRKSYCWHYVMSKASVCSILQPQNGDQLHMHIFLITASKRIVKDITGFFTL